MCVQPAPKTVELPSICTVIRRCPDHQYRGALPATRTVDFDNPMVQIAPNTFYVAFISIVIVFKFGNDMKK